MMKEQENRLKQMAEAEAKCGQSAIGGYDCATCATTKVAAPSLRERIHDQRYQAQVESRRAEQLMELEHLLDKNPETARIIELLEQVKY